MNKPGRDFWGLLVFATCFCAMANGASITVGTNEGSNGIPFAGYGTGNEYQQIFSSSAFSGTIDIKTIRFFAASFDGGDHGPASLGARISLSTVSTAVGSLSNNFASNEGTDETQVYNGIVTFTDNGTFDLVFDSTGFNYDPSHGNLLMDVVITSETGSPAVGAFSSSSLMQRVYNPCDSSGSCNTNGGGGLVTQFTDISSATPEPCSVWMLGGGLLAFFGLRRRIMA